MPRKTSVLATTAPPAPEGPAPRYRSYRFVGEQERVFPTIQRLDGRTLQVIPGETVILGADPGHPLLQPVAG